MWLGDQDSLDCLYNATCFLVLSGEQMDADVKEELKRHISLISGDDGDSTVTSISGDSKLRRRRGKTPSRRSSKLTHSKVANTHSKVANSPTPR